MAKFSILAAVAMAALATAFLMMAEQGQAYVDCNTVRNKLAPCTAYLTGSANNPSAPCCSGVKYIKDNTVSKTDRQSTCQCLKDTASKMTKLKDSAAQQIGRKCNVQISVPISRTVDCRNI